MDCASAGVWAACPGMASSLLLPGTALHRCPSGADRVQDGSDSTPATRGDRCVSPLADVVQAGIMRRRIEGGVA
jgi:hypothetical protein